MKNVKAKRKFAATLASFALATIMGITCLFQSPIVNANAESGTGNWISYDLQSKSLSEAQQNSIDKAREVAEEGIVLLKNENSALPLSIPTDEEAAKPAITLFGKNLVNPVYGGSGSAGGSGGVERISYVNALRDAGYSINPATIAFYNDTSASGRGRTTGTSMGTVYPGRTTGETPISSYADYSYTAIEEDGKSYASLQASYADYSDAAIVFLSRIGGEGFDLSTTSYATTTVTTGERPNQVRTTYISGAIDGRTDGTEHYLELDDNEKALIDMVTAQNFKKVIVILNAANPMELGILENNDKVDSVIYMGFPGSVGFGALADILSGKVNPSGRTVDSFAADLTADPTYANFGVSNNYGYAAIEGYEGYTGSTDIPGNQFINQDGSAVESKNGTRATMVEYEEGIYTGYRYWETRGFTENDSCAWYNSHVVYPFGYGLSYTSFSWDVEWPEDTTLSKGGTITVKVTVKNTGEVAGKEVVQLYYSAPYTTNGIEKSHVNLGTFAKTKLLSKGESETLTLTLKVEDMASYDYSDANGNGYKTWEVEEGDYTLYVGANSHCWAESGVNKKVFTANEGYAYEMDIDGDQDGNDNQFDDISDYIKNPMSRADFEGTFPTAPTVEERTKDAEFLSYLNVLSTEERNELDKTSPWYVEESEMPTQAKTAYKGNEKGIVKLADLLGKDYDDPLWDTFLNQLTVEQLASVVEHGFFQTQPIDALGVPVAYTPDGSTGFNYTSGANDYTGVLTPSYCVIAGTFNTKLAEEFGSAIGEEGVWANCSGIYAFGANTHRSPFGGRNFEYFSEDGVLAGYIAAGMVKGIQSKGVVPLCKHFAFNDQETDREGVTTWFTEQAAREIYLRSFQAMVEEGGSFGIMSSFNRIGNTFARASYPLLTNVLRKEWGFEGAVITDWGMGYEDLNICARAGNDYFLGNASSNAIDLSEAALTATHVTALRNSAKHVFNLVLHSNAMNKLNGAYEDVVNSNLTLYGVENNLWGMAEYSEFYNTVSVAAPYYSMKYDNISYVLDGELPEGLLLNEDGSIVQGEISLWGGFMTLPAHVDAGTYRFSVVVLADGQVIGQTAEFTLTVSYAEPNGTELIQQVASQITNLETIIDQVGALNGGNGELKAKLEAEVSNLKGLLNTADASVEALQNALASANAALLEANTAIGNLQTTTDSQKTQIDGLNTQIGALQSQIKNLESTQSLLGTGLIIALVLSVLLIAGAVAGVIVAKKKLVK